MDSLSTERFLIGSILVSPHTLGQTERLSEQEFSLPAHREILGAMRELSAAHRDIEIGSLVEILDRRNSLEAVGGIAYLDSLTDGAVVRDDIGALIDAVKEHATRRRGGKVGERLQRIAADPSISPSALLDVAAEFSVSGDSIDPPPPRFSEEAVALRFSREHAGALRYCAAFGKWYRWDGNRWRPDDTLAVYDLCRTICRKVSAECGESEKSAACRIASGASVAAVERLARADRRHAVSVQQWDARPWLLCTPSGTVELQTGELRASDPEDYLTKVTTAGPGGQCPTWIHFLNRVTDGNVELQHFLQRYCGYCLTGVTREQTILFLYGTGANGKSVFLSTLATLLGDFARTAPMSVFTTTNSTEHPTELAGLRGARLVIAIETEEGARWAESRIKSLTGGDKIAARYMRQDFFEFVPEFKLVVAGNHKPSLRSVDEAIRRRLYVVPFTVTIPADERDPALFEKLRTEYPGILQWAIDGCLSWQRDGLRPPEAVRLATEQYLAAEDAIGRWIEDHCIAGSSVWCSSSALFANWGQWCDSAGERPGTQKRFAEALQGRGFIQERTRAARGFAGIALRDDVTHVTGPSIPTVTRARTPYIGRSVTSVTDRKETAHQ